MNTHHRVIFDLAAQRAALTQGNTMQAVTIYDTRRYRVVSHGNGLAYTFTCKSRDGLSDLEVFFQGDDAAIFRHEIEQWEAYHPHKSCDAIFHEMWGDYSHIAQSH